MHITRHSCDSSAAFLAQLDDLMLETFGFTFAAWQQTGAWNADYTSYTISRDSREERQVLSNASVYRMELLVNGQKQEAYQIGAVATRKECRGMGLSRRILQFILDQHPGGIFFLFANPSVLDFYPRFGFRSMTERQPSLQLSRPLAGAAPGSARRLPVSEFQSTAMEYFQRRACFSRILDCANAAPVNLFNLLYEYPQAAYEIADLQTLLVAEQRGSTLTLIDICAARPLSLTELLPYLDFPGVETLRFGFNPDWLEVECEWGIYEEDDAFFVRGPLELTDKFIMPWMIRT